MGRRAREPIFLGALRLLLLVRPIDSGVSALCAYGLWERGGTLEEGNCYGRDRLGYVLQRQTSSPWKPENSRKNNRFKFAPGLILLMFLIVCTAYVLAKLP
jgi:hypothetical protein